MRRAALVLVLGLLATGCGEEEEPQPAATTAASPAATATPTPPPEATATPSPASPEAIAIWPHPDSPGDDPVEVARSLVVDYVGNRSAALSEFREGEPGAGEVDVLRADESGGASDVIVATISLRRIENKWSVTSVASPEVVLEAPAPLATITSPVTVSGRGRGFEGNVVLEVRALGDTNPLAQKAVTAGSAEGLEPFSTALAFEGAGTDQGAILAYTGSGLDKANGFTVVPIRF